MALLNNQIQHSLSYYIGCHLKKNKQTTVNNLEIVKNIITDKNNNNNKTDYENNDDNQHMQFILLWTYPLFFKLLF